MNKQNKTIGTLQLCTAMLRAAASAPGWLYRDSSPAPVTTIPADFLGINVAPSEDPLVDDYILDRLAELGLQQVRMDFSYSSFEGPAERLLKRLLAADIQVLLNVFPPVEQAGLLATDTETSQRWSDFLARVFEQYQGLVATFEIGNTPNRGRWSGFTAASFVHAWVLAATQARQYDIELAGPNVSDFEPLYNATLLSLMNTGDRSPDIHTDNLFVERVVEPEAYDHRALGRAATGLIKLNLIKKARVLQQIGVAAGCREFYCTYTMWTTKRLSRRNAWPEEKRVDYLLRYLVLAVSSEALRKVYWGPLICNRDGLIDDGATDYPEVDQVSFYEQVRGELQDFTITDGFSALRNSVELLSGARCRTLLHEVSGLSLFALEREPKAPVVVAWCRDALSWPLTSLFDEQVLDKARFQDATGQFIARPAVVNEHPLIIHLAGNEATPTFDNISRAATPDLAHLAGGLHQSISLFDDDWRGAAMLRTAHQAEDLQQVSELHPEKLVEMEETQVLRNARNRLWNVADPRGRCQQVTVKLNRVVGQKRISYRFRPSKGRRHWNNACQMLRRGVSTPLPVAFFERWHKPGIRDSWYLCEFVPDAFSAREVYAAFREGASEYRGLNKLAWFDLLSGFVCNMHNKQVVHRDLSSGNLLLYQSADGTIVPQAIDIGRAWIWSGPGSRVQQRHRLLDLIRICYKLSWPDRLLFIEQYERHQGRPLKGWWRLPFQYYDAKQKTKKGLKAKYRKSRTRA